MAAQDGDHVCSPQPSTGDHVLLTLSCAVARRPVIPPPSRPKEAGTSSQCILPLPAELSMTRLGPDGVHACTPQCHSTED
jgi:hypothetical protein